MLRWFSQKSSQTSPGLERMRSEFGQMLVAGRHVFDTAANALLGGTDTDVIRDDLFETDIRINKAERQIRRELVVHASVHGAVDFPACLVLMSIVKDAERIGDYAKNIFDLADLYKGGLAEEHKLDLVQIKDRISSLLARCHEVFDNQDTEAAQQLINDCQSIEDHCDEKVTVLIHDSSGVEGAVPIALAYRYLKRVASHALNITTSVIQPVHKLDFVKDKKKQSGHEG